MSIQYVFVGERRSPTAIRMNVTWADGRLCAKNLHEALMEIGIDPEGQVFLNVQHDDGSEDAYALWSLKDYAYQRRTIIALGQVASRALQKHGVPHLRLVHPAGRGAIRRTERYREHVAAVLGGAP